MDTYVQWIGVSLLIGLLWLIWQLRDILLLVFAAIVMAVALDTLSQIPQRYGFRRGPALAMTALTLLVGAMMVTLIVIPPLIEQLNGLYQDIQQGLQENPQEFANWLAQLQASIQNFLPIQLQVTDPDGNALSAEEQLRSIWPQLQPTLSDFWRQAQGLISSSLTNLVSLFLVIILTILLVLDPVAYTRVFIQIFPSFYRPRIAFILQQCEITLRSWLVGILLTSVMVTFLSAMGLLILRVPYVLANAVLAGMLNFIPNIGPTLSVVAPLAAALTVSAWKAIFVLILYILIQQLESTVLTPVVMSRQVSLLPGLTLMAQVVFATFFGVLGLLLAVPLAAVLQVWIREALIRDILDPWTTPRALAPRISPGSHPYPPSSEASAQEPSACTSGKEDSFGEHSSGPSGEEAQRAQGPSKQT